MRGHSLPTMRHRRPPQPLCHPRARGDLRFPFLHSTTEVPASAGMTLWVDDHSSPNPSAPAPPRPSGERVGVRGLSKPKISRLSPPPKPCAIIAPFPPITRGADEASGGETGRTGSPGRGRGCRPPAGAGSAFRGHASTQDPAPPARGPLKACAQKTGRGKRLSPLSLFFNSGRKPLFTACTRDAPSEPGGALARLPQACNAAGFGALTPKDP